MSKIVVSSIGAFQSHGSTITELLSTLSSQNSRLNQVKEEVDEVDSEILKYLSHDETRRIDKVSKILLISGLACAAELGLEKIEQHKNDVGVVANTCFGAMASSKEFIHSALHKGDKNASPIIFPFSVPNAATGILTIKLGIKGFNTTISGYNPIGYAYDLLKLRRARGLFVSGFEEITEFIDKNKVEDNIFFYGNYSQGSVTMFMTTEDFAVAQDLPRLFEICGFSTIYNYAGDESFDNSEVVIEETLSVTVNNLLRSGNIDVNEIAVIVSAFSSNSVQAEMEKAFFDRLTLSSPAVILYPKDILGEAFASNNPLHVITGYNYLKENKSDKYALINNYDIGGNFSSLVIKI